MTTSTSTEQWRWQDGTDDNDYAFGAAIGPDDSCFVVGTTFSNWSITNKGGDDFAIAKLDNNGSLLWKWQNGSTRNDELYGVAMAQDGSVVVGGTTNGSYDRESEGGFDFVAMKLDSNGNVEWTWQDGTDEDDHWKAVAVGEDGSVLLAGYTCGNWNTTLVAYCDVAVAKLDLSATVLWKWQSGTENGDYAKSAVIGEDGSVLIVLETDGDWDGENVGGDDFAAVKLGANGTEIWRWQDGTVDYDYANTAVATTNGTFVLAGGTYGDWSSSNAGDRDFAALKLDTDGTVMWKWQEGTPEDDQFYAAVAQEGGSTILIGYTYGSWYGENAGNEGTGDFAAVKLDADGIVEWRWQGKADGTLRTEEQALLEDIHDSVSNLVSIIQTYEVKNQIPELFASSLLKRRQEEAKAVVNNAVSRLSGLGSDSNSQAITEWQRARNQRRSQHLEIPEDQVTLTDMLLGKGGFTDVFLAGYSGTNAAAKVVQIDREQPRSTAQNYDGLADAEDMACPRDEQERQLYLFNRELEIMAQLKSSHTVHVYGAITSRVDRLVLIMELMVGGDLQTLIRRADEPFPPAYTRDMLTDICSGMVFLHGKGAIHGNLKSSNVLFDHSGLAKIADFGTTKWIQLGASAGLASACVGTTAITSAHMSIPWTAPEVLDGEKASFESDAYSFGIVAWEIASRQTPWAGVDARSIFKGVVLAGDRPRIPRKVTAEIADMIRSCWAEDPSARPKFSETLGTMNSWQISN